MPKLFRTEAIAYRQRDWLGGILLIPPTSIWWLTSAVVLTLVATVLFTTFGTYARKARVSGYLVPDRGVIRLVPPQPGTMIESRVAEGRSVRRGDVLFVLAVGQNTSEGEAQAEIQASLTARNRSLQESARQQLALAQSQRMALDRQIAEMRSELETMRVERDLHAQRLALAQEAQRQYESLRNDNFVSFAQVRTKAEEVLAILAQQQNLDRQRAVQLRQIAVLEAQRDELPLRSSAQQGEFDRDLAKLTEQSAENEARRQIVVRAPQDGVVTAVTTQAGQSVTSSVAMASLLPTDARLEAHLFAPSSAVGFVRAHQTVLMRYQAFPYQKFGQQVGEVVQISRSPLQAGELANLALPAVGGEPLYRITVALDRQSVAAYGQAQPLVPGMQLEADVLLDRRRLIEWILEPVFGIAGRV